DYTPGSPIVTGRALAAGDAEVFTVVVTFTVEPAMTADERVCATQGDGAGQGAYNAATVDPNIGPDVTDDACVDIPDPDIRIVKSAVGAPLLVSGYDTYTQEYTLTVTNLGDGPGTYSLTDTPLFGDGATPTGATVDGVPVD